MKLYVTMRYFCVVFYFVFCISEHCGALEDAFGKFSGLSNNSI